MKHEDFLSFLGCLSQTGLKYVQTYSETRDDTPLSFFTKAWYLKFNNQDKCESVVKALITDFIGEGTSDNTDVVHLARIKPFKQRIKHSLSADINYFTLKLNDGSVMFNLRGYIKELNLVLNLTKFSPSQFYNCDSKTEEFIFDAIIDSIYDRDTPCETIGFYNCTHLPMVDILKSPPRVLKTLPRVIFTDKTIQACQYNIIYGGILSTQQFNQTVQWSI